MAGGRLDTLKTLAIFLASTINTFGVKRLLDAYCFWAFWNHIVFKMVPKISENKHIQILTCLLLLDLLKIYKIRAGILTYFSLLKATTWMQGGSGRLEWAICINIMTWDGGVRYHGNGYYLIWESRSTDGKIQHRIMFITLYNIRGD